MKTVLLIILATLPAACIADPNATSYGLQMWGYPHGFIVIEYHAPAVITKDWHFTVTNASVRLLDSPNMFRELSGRWLEEDKNGLRLFTMNEFAVLARHWKGGLVKPEIIPEPNEPNIPPAELPMVWTAVTSGVYHWYADCSYWRDTMASISIVDALLVEKRPCVLCQKRKDLE